MIGVLPSAFFDAEAANEYSGRGVGLDVVRQMVEAFGGHLHLESTRGEGSKFIMHLPLTLTIIESIRFQTGDRFFAVPAHQVVQFVTLPAAGTGNGDAGRKRVLDQGRAVYSVISLRKFYHIPGTPRIGSKSSWRISRAVQNSALWLTGWQISSLGGEIASGHFRKAFKKYTGISGCSLLGTEPSASAGYRRPGARNTGGGKTHE